MTEHPTRVELDEYCRRVLAPGIFLSVHNHVAVCSECAAQCNSRQDLARDLEDLHAAFLDAPNGTPFHLSAAEVTAYARGSANEIDCEIAESHLGTCSTCLSEVQHLHERRSLLSWWQFPQRRLRLAAALACALILAVLAVWFVRSRTSQLNEQADLTAPPSSTAATEQAPSTPDVSPNPVTATEQSSADAQVALLLRDGKQNVAIDTQGRLVGLEQLPSSTQQKIRSALQTGKLERSSALHQLAARPSALLGTSENGLPFPLLSPLAQVVRSQQPTFRWSALTGAQSYTVVVTDAELNQIATSPPLKATEWRISKPLKEGGIYSWQVTALKDGVAVTSPVLPAPQAKFKIIDRATAETLRRAQRAYPDSHLTLAVLYAEAGLLEAAEQQLRMLVGDNPHAPVVQKLLLNVRAMRAP
jgi:hypothetical protein